MKLDVSSLAHTKWGCKCRVVYEKLLSDRQPEDGLGECFLRATGPAIGRGTLLLLALWFCVYNGFVLWAAGERLVSSVYPQGRISSFAVVLAFAAGVVAAGSFRSVARSAEAFVPIVMLTLLVVLSFAAPEVKTENLFPVSSSDPKGLLLAAAAVFDVLSIYVYFLLFRGREKEEKTFGKSLLWMLMLVAIIMAIMLVTVGTLSAEIAGTLANPFFAAVKNIRFIDTVERVEAVVVALWVVTDILYVSALIRAAGFAVPAAIPKAAGKKFILDIGGAQCGCKPSARQNRAGNQDVVRKNRSPTKSVICAWHSPGGAFCRKDPGKSKTEKTFKKVKKGVDKGGDRVVY